MRLRHKILTLDSTPQNGFEVEELHNVVLTSKSTGDMLKWNGTQWVNFKGVSGSFTSADSKTVTVTNGIITSIS